MFLWTKDLIVYLHFEINWKSNNLIIYCFDLRLEKKTPNICQKTFKFAW